MAETNEYTLQALWWKRVLSAFTKRHDRQEIRIRVAHAEELAEL